MTTYVYNKEEKKEIDGRKVTVVSTIIESKTEHEVLEMMKKKELHISKIIDPTPEMQLLAVDEEKTDMAFIQNPDMGVMLKYVREYPYGIQYIENPPERVCVHAVRQNPKVLEFIKNQTEKIVTNALRSDPFAAEFVKDFKEEYLEYMDKYPESLRLVPMEIRKKDEGKWNNLVYKCLVKKPEAYPFLRDLFIDDEVLKVAATERCINKNPYAITFLSEIEQAAFFATIVKEILKDGTLVTILKGDLQKITLKVMKTKRIESYREIIDEWEFKKGFKVTEIETDNFQSSTNPQTGEKETPFDRVLKAEMDKL